MDGPLSSITSVPTASKKTPGSSMVCRWLSGAYVAVVLCVSQNGIAQQALTLQQAASKAVLTNPEVLARYHAFNATSQERRVAYGAFLPTLDVVGGVGR